MIHIIKKLRENNKKNIPHPNKAILGSSKANKTLKYIIKIIKIPNKIYFPILNFLNFDNFLSNSSLY